MMAALTAAASDRTCGDVGLRRHFPAKAVPEVAELVLEGAGMWSMRAGYGAAPSDGAVELDCQRCFAGTASFCTGSERPNVHSGMRGYRSSMLRALDFDPNGPALRSIS